MISRFDQIGGSAVLSTDLKDQTSARKQRAKAWLSSLRLAFPATWRARRGTKPQLALFIDADNINDGSVAYAVPRLAHEWDPVYRRAYGTALVNRANVLREYGVHPVEVVKNSPRKNSADIALVVDAMTALDSGAFDAFAIVSNDGDFTRLVVAIRERGIPVLVFGGEQTPMALRRASTHFHLLPPSRTTAISAAFPGKKGEFLDFVRSVASEKGWTTLQTINSKAMKRYVNFSPKRFGAPSLRALLASSGFFEVAPLGSGKARDYLVRISEYRTTECCDTSVTLSSNFDRCKEGETCMIHDVANGHENRVWRGESLNLPDSV